ncbi:hypothetical protein LSCM4_06047 [Leishmania orientalis]|uniref:Uncharacterized protein n=1 Tax=Leishmania orientalis TaxID=2249476 RepID=A0A836HYX7_9TRYP|nr:hypothetical protein LSCM4_06047 [Leishmania orientalis]
MTLHWRGGGGDRHSSSSNIPSCAYSGVAEKMDCRDPYARSESPRVRGPETSAHSRRRARRKSGFNHTPRPPRVRTRLSHHRSSRSSPCWWYRCYVWTDRVCVRGPWRPWQHRAGLSGMRAQCFIFEAHLWLLRWTG